MVLAIRGIKNAWRGNEKMNRIKELRIKNNLTLRQLGKELNMRDSTLSQYENKKRNPKLEIWQKIANYFDVSVQYLKGYDTMRASLWVCSKCKGVFWASKLPEFCPYCKSENIGCGGFADFVLPGGIAK